MLIKNTYSDFIKNSCYLILKLDKMGKNLTLHQKDISTGKYGQCCYSLGKHN
jgi:hypothetical protein